MKEGRIALIKSNNLLLIGGEKEEILILGRILIIRPHDPRIPPDLSASLISLRLSGHKPP